jgi:acetyl-CoA carboxylase biotin carboxylase subunit
VRVDSHLYSGYTAPSNYDSLLGKVLVWGKDRDEAIMRMRRAMSECIIIGPPTTIAFHQRILEDARFVAGEINTGLVPQWLSEQSMPELVNMGTENALEPAAPSSNGRVTG